MINLFAIDSSILGNASVSRQLTHEFINLWQQQYPNSTINYRDLQADPINHLSQDRISAANLPPDQLSEKQLEEHQLSNHLIEEFLSADVLVIGAPMYNFTIPSQLKAWIDRILVAGRTFKYTDKGVLGLAGGKRLFIVSTRGGQYSSAATMQLDHQESYLKAVFNFVGIDEITIIRAEGLHLGEAVHDQSLASAKAYMQQLLKEAA